MRGYVREAARRVFGDPSWWWRALVLGGLILVPYVGAFVAVGYYMILIRDTSWGLDRGLPKFGEYRLILRRAWDGFVVGLVWGLAIAVPFIVVVTVWAVTRAASLVRGAPRAAAGIPWWLLAAVSLASAALAVFVNVAVVRTAVYLKPSAGLTIKGVRELIGRDPEGFRAVTGFMLSVFVAGLLLSAPSTYLHYFVPVSKTAAFWLRYGLGFAVAAFLAPVHLMVQIAYGLWAKGTNPSTWPPLHEMVQSQDPSAAVAAAQATAPVESAGESDSAFETGD